MGDLNEKVLTAKNALTVALGDNTQKYFNNMKFWFRKKWSKEEFDIACRKLLTPDKIHLHNQFLLAILNKIDAFQPGAVALQNSTKFSNRIKQETNSSSGPSESKKRKKSSRSGNDRSFESYDFCDFLKDDNMDTIIKPPPNCMDYNNQSVQQQRYCAQELFLPDTGFIMGRLLVGAWENGLVNAEDVAAEYIAMAVQVLLKNILTAVITKRKHYKVNSDGKYFYDIGTPIKDPFLKNTISRQKIDDAPLELDREITSAHLLRRNNDDVIFLSACEELYPIRKRLITVPDLYRALQDKNIIPSHTVYAVNMERIAQMLQ
ncbi:transcriptional adapter 1-like [Condylostylus longicornis]|uniref:transcriptional adapter 1-like n=1 Tax=Condylostylus longicornis TaxID=2530218 RepID=UPI00244E1534|nr:transcriptional adapter 1-like [Condylostylus longicornis]